MKELHNTDWSGLHSCVVLVTVTSVWGGVRWVVVVAPHSSARGDVGTGAGPWSRPGDGERNSQARPGRGGMGGVTPVLL